MEFISIKDDYFDPERLPIEIVERKGIGHPDSLADALANEISNEYSNYCLDQFGFILHHNLDKLYIGAGHFINDFKKKVKIAPIEVRVNGRMSSSFENQKIDLFDIQKSAIQKYLAKVLPHLLEEDFILISNSTQRSKISNWFTPKSKLHNLPCPTPVCRSLYLLSFLTFLFLGTHSVGIWISSKTGSASMTAFFAGSMPAVA